MSSNKISLTCNVNSNITKINYSEGEYIKKDSIISELNSSEMVLMLLKLNQLMITIR
jgi:hypothetical protein